MHSILTTIFLVAAVGSAAASTVTIELPGDAEVDRQAVTYKCGDREVKAEYINLANNSLAVLGLGDETIIAVTVLSGSGARYTGQQYVWWTKGDNADLYDLTKGEDAPPTLSCTASS